MGFVSATRAPHRSHRTINPLVDVTMHGAPRCLELVRSSANPITGSHFYSYPAVSTDCLVHIDDATLKRFTGC